MSDVKSVVGSIAEAVCVMLKTMSPFILPWRMAEWMKKIQNHSTGPRLLKCNLEC